MDIANRLKEIRAAQNVSVYKLAKNSDVSENYIRSIEKGEKQPSIVILEKLSLGLGISIQEFFNDNREVFYPSDFEIELINYIRALPQEKADLLLDIAKAFFN